MTGVPSRKLIEEVSPRSGRKNLAHGVGWGPAGPPSPPPPRAPALRPRAFGRRAESSPRAYALGYFLPPLTGLRKACSHEENFVNELPTGDTSLRLTLPFLARPNLFGGD